MLTYLLGPILALLPIRWRHLLPVGSAVEWRRAMVLSGFGESVVALFALVYWYSYYMSLMMDHGLDAAITGKMGPGVTDVQIGSTAMVIWAMHPLTWLIAYAGFEGSVCLVGAAFTETNLGILPLFAVDQLIGAITGRSQGELSSTKFGFLENLSSYVGAIRERVVAKGLTAVPDEICFTGNVPDDYSPKEAPVLAKR